MSGVVVIQSKGELHHQGITLTMDGTVSLQLSAKNVGMFEAFYRSIKVWYGIHVISVTVMQRLS